MTHAILEFPRAAAAVGLTGGSCFWWGGINGMSDMSWQIVSDLDLIRWIHEPDPCTQPPARASLHVRDSHN